MEYTRQYENRINWQNTPSVSTPINATNLNKMDSALNYIDGKMAEIAGEDSACVGLGKKVSVSSDVVDTDIILGRAPEIGDRYLIYFDSRVNEPTGIKVYGTSGSDAHTLSFGPILSDFYLNGLCLVEVYSFAGNNAIRLIYRDEIGVYSAGTGITISNSTIINSKPQLGDDVKGYDITSTVSSGSLGTFDANVDYIIINFKADASPNNSGKYDAILSSSSGGVAIMKYAVLKKLDGTFYGDEIYTGMSLICKSNDGGTGSAADPVILTVIAVNNGYVDIGRKANTTVGDKSTAEGQDTTASGTASHAENYGNTASGHYSHAQGYQSTASGNSASASGISTTASGDAAFTSGSYNTASGSNSTATGDGTTASGAAAFSGGEGTRAGYANQTALGQYNSNKSGNLFEIGNGSDDDNRSNAFEVSSSGNVKASGTITDGEGNTLTALGDIGLSVVNGMLCMTYNN